MKKKILFITKGVHAASTRYRALNYFPYLRKNGWTPCHLSADNSIFRPFKVLNSARKADVVVVLRKTFNGFFSNLLHRFSKHLIFDMDDAIFCHSDGTPSQMRAKRFKNIANRCDQIWAGNSYLASMALRHNPSVVVLPTSLSPEKYFLTTTKNNNFLELVWIGSSATKRYLNSALPLLEEIAESIPDLRLKIVADFDLTAQKLPVQSIVWSEEIEAEALASSHIGIAPMPDDAWTQGKCGLKILQYMAAGLPVISSPSGVNKDIVKHGINGFLAQNPEDWKAAIKHLAQNPDQRQRMGQAGRKTVLENYSLDATFTSMATALDAIMENPGKNTQ